MPPETNKAQHYYARSPGAPEFASVSAESARSPDSSVCFHSLPPTSCYSRLVPVATMAEEPPQKFSPHRLGEYTVKGEIAEGTFGKVKSKHTSTFPETPRDLHSAHSGRTHRNRAEGRDEVHLKARDREAQDEDEGTKGGRVHARAEAPPHHQTVRTRPISCVPNPLTLSGAKI